MSLKLLLDENIPPQVATELRRLDYDAIHLILSLLYILCCQN